MDQRGTVADCWKLSRLIMWRGAHSWLPHDGFASSSEAQRTRLGEMEVLVDLWRIISPVLRAESVNTVDQSLSVTQTTTGVKYGALLAWMCVLITWIIAYRGVKRIGVKIDFCCLFLYIDNTHRSNAEHILSTLTSLRRHLAQGFKEHLYMSFLATDTSELLSAEYPPGHQHRANKHH